MIVERCKERLVKHNMDCDETRATVEVMVPTAYSFPSTGTLLGLGFILFSLGMLGPGQSSRVVERLCPDYCKQY